MIEMPIVPPPCMFDPRKDCLCKNQGYFYDFIVENPQLGGFSGAKRFLREKISKLNPDQIQTNISVGINKFYKTGILNNCKYY